MNFLFSRWLPFGFLRMLLGLCCVGLVHKSAGGTFAFTYQGQLKAAGIPANGVFDLRFALYDAETGGAAGDRVINNAYTVVTNGLISAPLDFGTNVFDGTDYWIELGVRTNGSTAEFVVLAPRQAVTPTPYALFAGAVNGTSIRGTLPDEQLSTNIARLDADAVFSGTVQFANSQGTFSGSYSGDGSGLTNLVLPAFPNLIATTNPQIHGVVQYLTDITSVTEQVATNYDLPTGPPNGYVWRSLVPADDVEGQTKWCVTRRSAITLNPPWVQPVVPTGWPTVTSTEFVFGTDASSFVILLRGNGSYLGIEVDGADDLSRWYTPADVRTHFYTVNFGSSARRQIALKLSGNYQFGGLYLPATNGIGPAFLPRQLRLIVVGDSFSEEINSTSWPTRLMSLFRNLDVWSSSVGSTGYLNPGSPGRVNFRDRLVADVVSHQPDYVLFAGGINDSTITTNDAARAALFEACLSCYQTIQTNLPSSQIIALGPFSPLTPRVPSIVMVNEAISNACVVAGIGSNYVDTISDPWVTGVWNQPGSGTAVNYTSGDSTHPTPAGHWNIAYRVAAELARRFPELQPREKTR